MTGAWNRASEVELGRDDWYRNKEWDGEIEAAFEAKFARTRKSWSRWQYLTVQAGLLESGHPDKALEFYRRSLDLDGVEPRWVADSYCRMGLFVARRGDREQAIEHLHAARAACPLDQRRGWTNIDPERALGRLLWFQARTEAEAILNTVEPPDWGEVPEIPKDAGGHPYESPDDAAESLVVAFHVTDRLTEEQLDALFAADPAILATFDELLLHSTLLSVFRPWHAHGRFEIPGFIGRCLVRHAGAEWVEGEHLPDWGIRVRQETFGLYGTIWPRLGRGVPLLGIYREFADHSPVRE